jgi:hypothetical protein
MVLLAFSVEDQVEKYGAYVGIAAFFGLAILTLLYFAQAREVKRLREWAGRAPERAAELEQAVAEHAQEARRAPQPAVQAQPQQVVPEPVAATNGVVKLQPAELAALAFARAAGVHEPHEPKPHPAPAAAVAAAVPTASTTVAEPEAEPVLNGGGNGSPPAPVAPPPATPAARRSETPPPLPPRRKAAPAARRPAPAPEPRESSTRAVVITAVVGVLVLAAAAIFAFGLPGGGDEPQQSAGGGNPTAEPGQDGGDGGEGGTTTPKPTATPVKKSEAQVFVFNGTATPQLAARFQTALTGEGWAKGKTAVGSLAEDQYAQTSVVMYGPNAKRVANLVATDLGIDQVAELDDAIKTALADTDTAAGKDWNVVVVLGQDKST